ncbi:protein phosphatase 1 regulatory subunit 16A-like [Uloborus diversus]|uniref:protein phosphatase 1 regulatory subunit 16A-like n=1 Tax=Uloborus diversus TaxID=327109 RepID=UPI0024093FB6|nr:protein phosphatase 1 regulatory subunit 16A-like [Uloborus diversus]
MAEHSELIAEMSQIDKMTTQERLKLAKRRRMQQLKKWSQREKEYNSNKRKKELVAIKRIKKNDYKVHFVPSVMLLEAAARNDIEEVKRLLMLGVSPDSTNEDGLTALHQCCIDDSEEMMRLLLEFGANVNAKDSEQWTPLHAAATCGHIHIVKYLISKGADLLAVNADGNMPYDICDDDSTLDYIENEMAKKGITQEMIDQTRASVEVRMLNDLKEFAARGGKLDFRDRTGASPLHIAAANGYLSVLEFLLDQHVTIDVNDDDQWQPIHAAACWGHPDAIEMLVQAGADINAKTKNGETPYDISEDIEVRERIMQLKFEMETKRGSQTNRLRRTHSQNTRSQSIRRTSIREKAQISRREAREEARLRHEKEDDAHALDDDELKNVLDASQRETTTDCDLDPKDIDISFLPIDGKDTLQRFRAKTATEALELGDCNKRFNTCDNTDVPNETEGKPQNLFSISKRSDSEKVFQMKTAEATSVIQQKSGQSVNVEIHVTVNTSPTYGSSLADLKKQRCDQRNSITSTSSVQETNGKSMLQNGHVDSCNNLPSPSVVPKKYHGDPLHIVGERKKKRGCCNLM